LEVLRRLVKVC
jgi:hypothetical protein